MLTTLSELDRECTNDPPITATFRPGEAKGPGWDGAAHNWRVTLRYQGRTMTVDFFGGEAVTSPTVGDVVSSLILDAESGALTFEDFCYDFGYDRDSISAQSTWKACRQVSPRVRKLLGESFQRFAECEH